MISVVVVPLLIFISPITAFFFPLLPATLWLVPLLPPAIQPILPNISHIHIKSKPFILLPLLPDANWPIPPCQWTKCCHLIYLQFCNKDYEKPTPAADSKIRTGDCYMFMCVHCLWPNCFVVIGSRTAKGVDFSWSLIDSNHCLRFWNIEYFAYKIVLASI